MKTTTCKNCKKEFNYQPSGREGIYCSRDCMNDYKTVTTECQQCGKQYEVYRSRSDSKYCSEDCHYESKKGKNIPWLDEIRKEGVCLNSGKTHFKKGERPSPETEFEKGHDPWNKGEKNVYSDETLKKMSKQRKGMRVSKETEFKEGHTPWNKNMCMPDDWAWNKGKEVPSLQGENNHNWKGGVSDERDKIKKSKEYQQWRLAVYREDGFACVKCDSKDDIVAHHIEGFADNPDKRTDKENGVTFCRSCHAKFHHKFGFGNNNAKQLNKFLTN